MNKQEIQDNIDRLTNELKVWNSKMEVFKQDPKNNVFETFSDAASKIEDELYSLAHEACEGSYNCGLDQYSKQFYVGENLYIGVSTFQYNRHDKMYYYIDEHEFKVSLVSLNTNESNT